MNSAVTYAASLIFRPLSALLFGGALLACAISAHAQTATPDSSKPATAAGWGQPSAPAAAGTPAKPSTQSTTLKNSPPANHSKQPARKPVALVPVAPDKPVAPPTPAEMPAQPAVVHYVNGTLSVRASNSSLEQILREVGTQTGTQIQGVPDDERVFGVFGPGSADRVLAQLLDGSNSNFLILGHTATNAPKVLVITPRTSLAPGAQTAQASQPAASDDDDDDDAPPPERPVPMRPLIPNGAGTPGATTGVRTPQQILEEMQQRRQQEQQQQQDSPPQQ
jgi:hypothetical protein